MNELSGLFSLDFSAYLQGPWLVAAMVGIGLLIGMLTGLFGVGGAFLLNPFLIVLMGIQETLAVGTSLGFCIGTGSAGVARHLRMQNVDLKAVAYLVAGSLPCVLLGNVLHEGLRDRLGADMFSIVFRIFYLVILLLTAWIVFRQPRQHASGKSVVQRMRLGPDVELPNSSLKEVSVVGLLLAGGTLELLQGLIGIGGGVILVPLLIAVVGLNMHMAVGTSLGVVLLSSLFGTGLYGQAGEVNMLLVMSLLLGSVVGVQLGAWICWRLHATRLQRSFGYVVLLAVLLVAIDLSVRLINR